MKGGADRFFTNWRRKMSTKNVLCAMLVLFAVLLFLGCGPKRMY